MERHFVTFYSPGSFVSEQTTKPIDEWNVDAAVAMSREIVERYNAKPFGFRFSTRARDDDELDSREVASGVMHYLGGKIETLAEIEARNDPSEDILRSNMRCNGWDRVLVNTNSWKHTSTLHDGDIVLDVVI